MRVNGKVATLGDRVMLDAQVKIDGDTLSPAIEQSTRVILYNKPVGEVCTRHDPEGRPTVFDHLPQCDQGRWIVIGRLDYHTQGLLLFTNDGELANDLMHPRHGHEREYRVRIIGDLDDAALERIRKGVRLQDGMAQVKKIERLPSAGGKNQWLEVVLSEGRNRLVRRLLESQNVTVSRLIRIRFGDYTLPKSLKPGQWREM